MVVKNRKKRINIFLTSSSSFTCVHRQPDVMAFANTRMIRIHNNEQVYYFSSLLNFTGSNHKIRITASLNNICFYYVQYILFFFFELCALENSVVSFCLLAVPFLQLNFSLKCPRDSHTLFMFISSFVVITTTISLCHFICREIAWHSLTYRRLYVRRQSTF